MGRQKHGEKVPLQHLNKERTINAEQVVVPERLAIARPRAGEAAVAGSYGRHAEPLDQRAREDRYRKQTGRTNRCQEHDEDRLDFMPPATRGRLLGLTPKQRRRSEHKERRADARLIPGGRRR